MQQGTATSVDELRMRREVLALREALEGAQFAAELERSRASAAHRAEIEELQAMVRGLREVMDRERDAHREALDALRRELGATNRELQAALVEARNAFDAERLALQAGHQDSLLAAGRVRSELEATVKQLRERIDAGV